MSSLLLDALQLLGLDTVVSRGSTIPLFIATISCTCSIEGTIQMFAAASLSPAVEDTFLSSALSALNLFVALAPVAYVSHLESKILVKLAESDLLNRLEQRGMVEFLPYGPVDVLAPEICQRTEKACDAFLMTICGPSRHLNTTRIQVYVSNTPAGTSLQNMQHWMQGINIDAFQMLDFGSEALNVQHYGSAQPPKYDLSLMSVPTALFAGQHDYLADPTDVQRLVSELPTKTVVYTDYQSDYAHLDYVWAPSAATAVYSKVSRLLSQYTPK
jgi:lysosomal acid lipase/cholesteryl ester hydrolase